MTKWKCSLCPQDFDDDDPLFEKRKERHEFGRHTRHTVISERDGSIGHGMGNLTYGKVEWIKID